MNFYSERDLLPEGGQTQPQKKDKLEGEVEGEPVDDVHQRLNDGEEGENDPVLQTRKLVTNSHGQVYSL